MKDDLKTQLTAWALDELPPDEHAAIEARLGALPEAKAYAEDTRQFCTLLTQSLAPVTETTLTPDQHAELARQFRTVAPAEKVVRFRPASLVWVAGLGAVAAALVLWSGRFLAPPPATVAMGWEEDAPEAARTSALSGQSDGKRLFDVNDIALEEKTDGLNVLRRGLAEGETVGVKAEVSQALSLAQNAPPDSPDPSRTQWASFGLNADTSGAAPADPLGNRSLTSEVAKRESEKPISALGTEASLATSPTILLTQLEAPALLAKETAPDRLAESKPDSYYRYVIPTPPESTTESYAAVPENPFKTVAAEPLSTFSIDVDTAAYANARRFLNQGQRPPQPAVRIEEMVNYFRYDYPQPEAGKPFSVTVDLADCPWQPQHRLARVGLKGRDLAADKRPQSNLVFLIDVSGSMDQPNKLPLVQQSLRMLSSQLTEKDRVAMVTYAGNSGLALDSTNGSDRAKIGAAIDRLSPGGSTNGASGIQLAYEVAQQHFVKEGVNRVLLATDGDFNVGVTSQEALQKLITDRAKGGVFLSVLGYGMGNLKDSTMEMLADKGNGNYAYIDSLGEARKVLSEEMSGTLVTIAKDVKIQIEFNPAVVRDYRLLGYENRLLAREDFNDDKKDAGEIGAGHTVTALYQLVPVGAPPEVPAVDGLKYTPGPIVATAVPAARKPIDPAIARETMTVKLRYKAPDGETSQLLEVPVVDKESKFVEAPADFKFAASVTMFGMLLKDSAHKGTATWDQVRQFALEGKGPDPLGYRGEFIQLVEKARGVAP